jgi:hypothetical protein
MIKNKVIIFFTAALFAVSITAGTANAQQAGKIKKTNIKRQAVIANHKAIKAQLDQIRKLPKDQRRAKMQELRAKNPGFFKIGGNGNGLFKLRQLAKTNTQLASELKGLKGLSQEQRRAKLKEIKQKYN